jgi:adenylate cyclase
MYFTPPVAERFIPAWKVLEGQVRREEIEGFILFLGTSAAGLHDIHATPLGLSMPGVVLHAQFLEQVLHGVYLTRPDWAKGAEAFLIVLLGAVILLLGPLLGALWLAIIGSIVLTAAIAISWFAFAHSSILLDPLFPSIAVIATYMVWSVLSHMQTEREQRWVRTAFSSYLSPDLVTELIKHPERLKLGGERRELTFLFTDLEGFTSLVEQTAADVIVPLLNEYLDGMVRIAFRHGGTIDKIVGDALHVIFGAPLVQDDHAARAVACALEMDSFGQSFAESKRKEGVRFGITRIGVNTGRAVIGNFGGSLRFDYTAHGDAINTAARLESVNKHLGTRICISGDTVRLCPEFRGRPIGRLVLKGKSEGVETFEPLADGLADSEPMRAYLEAYHLLDEGNGRAREAFERLVATQPDDPLARFHWSRLQRGETTALVRMAEK